MDCLTHVRAVGGQVGIHVLEGAADARPLHKRRQVMGRLQGVLACMHPLVNCGFIFATKPSWEERKPSTLAQRLSFRSSLMSVFSNKARGTIIFSVMRV